jgi:ceramide glucosyltransferase
MDVVSLIGWGFLLLATFGGVYAVAASILVPRFLSGKEPSDFRQAAPPVTVLKPLHGDEAGLYDRLSTFCRQDYAGAIQVLCGIQHAEDRARVAVEHLQRSFPSLDIALVRDGNGPGLNRKVANLAAMVRAAKHEVLVLADSDISVEGDYLTRVVAGLGKGGAVTCLYRGEAIGGTWSRLSAMAIDYHFLPGVVVGLRLGLAAPCFGSTIAIRKKTLGQIGGFAAFADHLADDYEIGKSVRKLGSRVAIPSVMVSHACTEASFKDLFAHELRWARTIFTVDRIGYVASGVTHTLPLAILGSILLGFSPAALVVVAGSVAARFWMAVRVRRSIGAKRRSWFLFVARELLSFFVYCAAFFVRSVKWRDRRFRIGPNQRIASVEEC